MAARSDSGRFGVVCARVVVVLLGLVQVCSSTSAPIEPPTSFPKSLRPTVPPPAGPHTIQPGEWIADTINGYGWRYFTVEVDEYSFVDSIAIVDRNEAHSTSIRDPKCTGLAVYLSVQGYKPEPMPFESPGIEETGRLSAGSEMLALLAGALQQSVLCKPRNAARVSVKNSGTNTTWWLLVQTRRSAPANVSAAMPEAASPVVQPGTVLDPEHSDCTFRLHVEVRPRTLFIVLTTGFLTLGWIVAIIAARAMLSPLLLPQFRWWRWRYSLVDVGATTLPRCVVRAVAACGLLLAHLARSAAGRASRAIRSTRADNQQGRLLASPMEGSSQELREIAAAPAAAPEWAPPDEQPGGAPAADADAAASETSEAPLCRICRDEGDEEVVSPCDCQGSIRFVHIGCLQHWRRQCARARLRCELCNSEYRGVPAVAGEEEQRALEQPAPPQAFSKVQDLSVLVVFCLISGEVGKRTIGELSCMTAWGGVYDSGFFSSQNLCLGVFFYVCFVIFGYGCFYFQWLTWLAENNIDFNALPPDQGMALFIGPASVVRTMISCVALFFVFVLTGVTLKLLVYLSYPYLVWQWDASPCAGGFVTGIVAWWAVCVKALFRRASHAAHVLLQKCGAEWEVVVPRDEREAPALRPRRRRRQRDAEAEPEVGEVEEQGAAAGPEAGGEGPQMTP